MHFYFLQMAILSSLCAGYFYWSSDTNKTFLVILKVKIYNSSLCLLSSKYSFKKLIKVCFTMFDEIEYLFR